jgi:hypothetical protein
MGLLDDAIREHLDLKRRRGGDPAEIARLEQEALGPAQREPEPAPEAVAEPPADADAPAVGADPAPEPEAPDPHDSDVVHQPTTEFRVEDHDDEDEELELFADDGERAPEPAEDVLEETPDFLQETPEHDRLWFEQRPPRDFDFDD